MGAVTTAPGSTTPVPPPHPPPGVGAVAGAVGGAAAVVAGAVSGAAAAVAGAVGGAMAAAAAAAVAAWAAAAWVVDPDPFAVTSFTDDIAKQVATNRKPQLPLPGADGGWIAVCRNAVPPIVLDENDYFATENMGASRRARGKWVPGAPSPVYYCFACSEWVMAANFNGHQGTLPAFLHFTHATKFFVLRRDPTAY